MSARKESSLSKWESFLKPIKGEKVEQKTLGSNGTPSVWKNCLSGQVARKLNKNTSQRPADVGDDQTAKHSPTDVFSYGCVLSNTAQTDERRSKKPITISDDQSPIEKGSNTTDLLTPPSKWKLETFANYVDFESVVKRLTKNEKDQPMANTFSDKQINRLYTDIHGMFGDQEFGGQKLQSFITGETQARIVIDRLISEVCKELHIQFKTEQKIEFHYLPTGRLDYYFLSEDEPLGCLEAKSPKTLNKHAFAQAVMELLLVQEWGETSKSGKAFFCILSDGKRYVLMKVMGNQLYLEHDRVDERDVIKVRSLEEREDFNDLITSICYLIQEAKEGTKADEKKTGGQKADEKKTSGQKADEKKTGGKNADDKKTGAKSRNKKTGAKK